MEGFVYVEHDCAQYDVGADKYLLRYMVLYPFCGLRWYMEDFPSSLRYCSFYIEYIDLVVEQSDFVSLMLATN
jgi:hypothetical protein